MGELCLKTWKLGFSDSKQTTNRMVKMDIVKIDLDDNVIHVKIVSGGRTFLSTVDMRTLTILDFYTDDFRTDIPAAYADQLKSIIKRKLELIIVSENSV